MIILQTKGIDKSFGGTEVLSKVEIQVRTHERVGLVGDNGAGKSTLLKIITGELPPDDGEVILAKKARVGYLAQNSGLTSHQTIWHELNRVFSHLHQMEKELRQLEQLMGEEQIYSNEKKYNKILGKYASLQEEFEKQGGYEYEARIRGTLHGLGLGQIDPHTTSIANLSGGQKTRVALAKMLLEEPDLLILDEPTNYLDIQATEWLEGTLYNYKGAVLLVSHDRYFLDRLVSIIYEIENHQAVRYTGNYTAYMKQKKERFKMQQKAYEEQQAHIRKMEDFIERNISRASTTKRAQSRRKALEKMERLAKPQMKKREAAIRFDITVASGRQVLQVESLAVGYQTPLLQHLSFQIERGERIAIIGPNGIGKSTLLKTLVGQLPPHHGNLKWGTNIQIDYYDQEQQDLHPDKTCIDEIWDEHPELDQTTIRSYLGQFLFSQEDVFKKVSDLSGGEKARLSLLKRLLNQGNFLLMDEPTNHLDMQSKERLEQALEGYPGTLLFISHDRYFINRLANRIWEVSSEGIKDYPGTYEHYLERKALEKFEEEEKSETESLKAGKQHWKQEKQEQRLQKQRQQKINQLEEEITQLEQQIASIQEALCQPEYYTDLQKSAQLKEQLEKIEQTLIEKTDEWAELADQGSD